MILPTHVPRLVAASDAALEQPRQGSGGFHLVFQDGDVQAREAFVAIIPPQVYEAWQAGDRKIAQLELFMVVHALTVRAGHFAGDAVSGLSTTLPVSCAWSEVGATTPTFLGWPHTFSVSSSRCVLLCIGHIPSKSNCDAISRLGANDPWYRANHFRLSYSLFPPALLRLPYRAVITFAEFL